MLIVAITGGMGSGKSQVSRLFAKYDIPFIDADAIARQLSSKNNEAYPFICSHFGQSILKKNGEIDRAVLRKIVFSNEQERLWLEQLLHPMILKQLQKETEQISGSYCLVEIPLLAETSRPAWVNRILVVDAPQALRIERIKKRDGLSEETIEAILEAQADREKRLAIADDVIENKGSIQELSEKVAKLHHQYCHLR
jgi:dephospho-CoA kinase